MHNTVVNQVFGRLLEAIVTDTKNSRPYQAMIRLNRVSDAQLHQMGLTRVDAVMRVAGANTL